jgi:hypothetical protein
MLRRDCAIRTQNLPLALSCPILKKPSWYSDPFLAYVRGGHREQVQRDFQKEGKHAEKLLNIFDVWEDDVKRMLAECNKRYEEVKYTHNFDDKAQRYTRRIRR